MTKVELVKRIMVVTGWTDTGVAVTRPSTTSIRSTIMDCIDGFAETLLLQVRSKTEMALEKVITDTMKLTREQGQGWQKSDCPRCDDEINRR